MKIAADINGITNTTDPDLQAVLNWLWEHLVEEQKTSQFLFLTGRKEAAVFTGHPNSSSLPLIPKKSSLRYRYWLQVQLPALLKKTGSTVFVSSSGNACLNARLPQILLLTEPELLQQDRQAARYLKTVKRVIVFSAAWKKEIAGRYSIHPDRILVLPPALPHAIPPLSYEEKQQVKQGFSEGKEYFLYTGPLGSRHNLLNLLKGFSLFKKRQQSGIKILLAGDIPLREKSFADSLQTYKYREDVMVTGMLSDTDKDRLIAAAYAMIDTAPKASPGIMALQAASAQVPLLAAAGQPLPEDAYLPADMLDPIDIASRLMQVYKDENLRAQLISRAAGSIAACSLEKTASQLWEGLTEYPT